MPPTPNLRTRSDWGFFHNVYGAQDGSRSALDNPAELQREMDNGLVFALDSFRVGDLSDVGDMRWDAFVTKPQQDLIGIVISDMPYRIG